MNEKFFNQVMVLVDIFPFSRASAYVSKRKSGRIKEKVAKFRENSVGRELRENFPTEFQFKPLDLLDNEFRQSFSMKISRKLVKSTRFLLINN